MCVSHPPSSPLVVIHLTWEAHGTSIKILIEELKEEFWQHHHPVSIMSGNHFDAILTHTQLLIEHLLMTMTSWDSDEANKMQSQLLDFFSQYPEGKVLLTIHKRTDSTAGQLCNSWNYNQTVAFYKTIKEVLSSYLGQDVVNTLQMCSVLWGLLLLVCGASVGTNHISSVKYRRDHDTNICCTYRHLCKRDRSVGCHCK